MARICSIFIHGLSDVPLNIQYDNVGDEKCVGILRKALGNIRDYLQKFLGLDPLQLFVYSEGVFWAWNAYTPTLKALLNNEPLIVVWTEINLIEHSELQQHILMQYNLSASEPSLPSWLSRTSLASSKDGTSVCASRLLLKSPQKVFNSSRRTSQIDIHDCYTTYRHRKNISQSVLDSELTAETTAKNYEITPNAKIRPFRAVNSLSQVFNSSFSAKRN